MRKKKGAKKTSSLSMFLAGTTRVVSLKHPDSGYTIEEMWAALDALDGTARAVQPYARRPRCCVCGERVWAHQSWHNNGAMKHWACEIREQQELARRRQREEWQPNH